MNREELINQVKALVDSETAEELEYLRKENERLKEENSLYADYKTERARILAENNQLKRENNIAYNRGAEDIKKARLESLLDLEYGYTVTKQYEYKYPKCDKCDDNRVFHFTSPHGREMKEPCACSERVYSYVVNPVKTCAFYFGNKPTCKGDTDNKPSRYYKYRNDPADHEYREDNRIWIYDNLASLEDVVTEPDFRYRDYVFSKKEDAQIQANVLNDLEKFKEGNK